MRNLIIYGFGGFGHEVACLIRHINREKPTWNVLGFVDDGVSVGTVCKYGKVLGDLDFINSYPEEVDVVIAIGSSKIQSILSQKIVNPNVSFPNVIAPNVFFFDEESVTIGKGNIITFGCRISCNVQIGDFNVFNGNVSFGHDTTVGCYNVMFPETRISGQTNIGNRNFFGARTFVAQCLKIGSDTRFAAGSIVLRNTKDGFLYMGNPAKRIEL